MQLYIFQNKGLGYHYFVFAKYEIDDVMLTALYFDSSHEDHSRQLMASG